MDSLCHAFMRNSQNCNIKSLNDHFYFLINGRKWASTRTMKTVFIHINNNISFCHFFCHQHVGDNYYLFWKSQIRRKAKRRYVWVRSTIHRLTLWILPVEANFKRILHNRGQSCGPIQIIFVTWCEFVFNQVFALTLYVLSQKKFWCAHTNAVCSDLSVNIKEHQHNIHCLNLVLKLTEC